MGISGLFRVIEELAPRAIKKRNFPFFKNKKLAIDVSNLIHKSMGSTKRNNGHGFDTCHLEIMFARLNIMLSYNILPIAVFDGRSSLFKDKEVVIRKKRRTQYGEKYKLLLEDIDNGKEPTTKLNIEKLCKYAAGMYSFRQDDVKDLMYMLQCLGVPSMKHDAEADVLCAALTKNTDVYGVLSDDIDMLVHGAKRLVVLSTFNKKTSVLEISLSDVLAELGITYDQFVDMCSFLHPKGTPEFKVSKARGFINYVKCTEKYDFQEYLKLYFKGMTNSKPAETYVALVTYYKDIPQIDIENHVHTKNKNGKNALLKFLVEDKNYTIEYASSEVNLLYSKSKKCTDFFNLKYSYA